MAYLSRQETSAIEQNSSGRDHDHEKGTQERRGDWGFDEVMFVFLFARTLVFIDERHQLELNVLV